ncbi:tumor necrosis factor receptor superfamily member 1A [Aplochiton taeniatus]
MKGKDDSPTSLTSWIGTAGVLVLLAAGVVFAAFRYARKLEKKKMLKLKESLPASEISSECSTQALIHKEGPAPETNQAVPSLSQIRVCEHEHPSQLPDCVPPEIKIPDLIYSVLELVSVSHIKQLVRSLGVSERRIEEAERDHRVCREAHYQMLRVWAEGSRPQTGRGGGGGVLHRPLLQDLLEKLGGMDLGGPAQELEEKYGVQ